MQRIINHFNKSEKRYFEYIGKKAAVYWFAIFLAVITNAVLSVILAYVNKSVFNAIEFQNSGLFYHACVLAVIYVVLSYIYPYTRYFHIKIVRVMVYELKLKMFSHLLEQNMEYFDSQHSGDIIQRIGNDAESMKTSYFTNVFVLCNLVFGGVTALINMLFLNIKLTGIAIIFSAITVWISSKVNNRIKGMSKDIQKQISVISEKITNILSGFLVLKVYSGAQFIIDDFENANDEVAHKMIARTGRLSQLQIVTFLTGILASLGSIAAGTYLVFKQEADFGTVMAVVSLQISVSTAMQRLGFAVAKFHMAMAQAARVFDYMDKKSDKKLFMNTKEESFLNNHEEHNSYLTFHNVTFAYPDREPVLKRFNLIVEKNEKVIIMGHSGRGKSTIIKLLLGQYPYESGQILVDGNEIGSMNAEERCKLMAYVPQNSILFEGTVMENIRLARLTATDDEVKRAALLSFADEFIQDMPNKYDTLIKAEGGNLSGGQRQRIALARAFLKNVPILLMDEVTSALDTESENQIIAAVNSMADKTIIMITHRKQLADKCRGARIFMME